MPRVIANEGLKVPLEKQRAFIGSEPVDVPDSIYYRRRLETRELVLAPGKATSKPVALTPASEPDTTANSKSGSAAK
ncbi:MAG TPA: hypothetical protein VGM71_15990 [Luteibacter sp.]|jgi:hypothetical protein